MILKIALGLTALSLTGPASSITALLPTWVVIVYFQ